MIKKNSEKEEQVGTWKALYLYISCGNITTLLTTKQNKNMQNNASKQNKSREQFERINWMDIFF